MDESDYHKAVTEKITRFLQEIGVSIQYRELQEKTVLPGIDTEDGALVIDESRMRFPGDLLHEAGHLAVSGPKQRIRFGGDVKGTGGEELAAIAWSYAAALHIGIDPRIVFHDQGYKGWSESILENFANGHYFGVPMLDWLGLTTDPQRQQPGQEYVFPDMRSWLVA